MKTERRTPLPLLFERILAVLTYLGLICLAIGIPLFVFGRSSDDLTFSQIGAFVLLAGISFLGLRIFYWISEEWVGRGLEEMAKQEISISSKDVSSTQVGRFAKEVC